jgi:peptide/nickel transport system substrate-binding protein
MMVGLGLTAPMAAQMLASAGVAQAQSKLVYKPTKRGGGGALKTLWWQGATLLNPYFAVGTKTRTGRASSTNPWPPGIRTATCLPSSPPKYPTLQNGGLSKDGKTIVWKLKKDVQWHDGKPFTADDVVFNWEYAADPATAAYCIATYKDIKVEKIDALSVRVTLAKPTPFWADAFVGVRGMIIPKHVFDPFKGGKSREAPANLKPVGHWSLPLRGLQAWETWSRAS